MKPEPILAGAVAAVVLYYVVSPVYAFLCGAFRLIDIFLGVHR